MVNEKQCPVLVKKEKKLGEGWHTHEWSEGTHHHGQDRKSTYTSMQAK